MHRLPTEMPCSLCSVRHRAAFEELCPFLGEGGQPAATGGLTPTLLRYLTPALTKDPGKCKGCLPLSGTQSDSPCSQHLVSLTRQENKDTLSN